ncbi:hypothetical protein FQR65_LT18393 [Abscondita terminalis]|nr:hypothetical protein FQR65_LT04143 [Abscondita terminalis]KAF5307560.1 hypothetical protein FQR65_LT18393 [Abscondita terminalis]
MLKRKHRNLYLIQLSDITNTNDSAHKSNKDDNDFKTVTYKKSQNKTANTNKRKPIVGTNSSNTFSITAAPKKAWAFIGRPSPSVTEKKTCWTTSKQ